MMNHALRLFAVSFVSRKLPDYTLHVSGVLLASNEEEARRGAEEIWHDDAPVEEGWFGHSVSVFEIPDVVPYRDLRTGEIVKYSVIISHDTHSA